MKTKGFCFAVLIFSILVSGVKAQTLHATMGTTGGSATGTAGVVTFTIGQCCYTQVNSATNSVLQGIQQPYEIQMVSSIPTFFNIGLYAYPNPTSSFLILKIENQIFGILSYRIVDLNGKMIRTEMITTVETTINLSELPTSVYFVQVTEGNEVIKSFKIIRQ